MTWDPDCQGPCDCPGKERAEITLGDIHQALLELTSKGATVASIRWVLDNQLPPDPVPECGPDHDPVQHRDRKRPWCNRCGRAADGELIGRPRG